MSLETKTRIICDGCGTFIEGKPVHTSTLASSSYWDAKILAKASGWITQERPYKRDVHYCKDCADKPQQPIKAPERKKKCEKCREISKADKADTRPKMNMGWERCRDCGWKRTHWKYSF